MDKPNNKSKIQISRDKDKKSLVVGSLLVIIIALTPFIFYSYENFPDNSQVWESFLFDINTSYTSVMHLAWYLTSKAVPLVLLLIWFFTCKHWWHWIILVPIAMYSFQIWGILNESGGLDEVEIYYVIPLMMVLVPAVYLIRAKLFNRIRGNDLESFEKELMTKKSTWGQIKDLFR